MFDFGIYIVTLTNTHPISVNAQDQRMADRCIKVTCANCKVGKAKSFIARRRNYHKTFGADHVQFRPIAYTQDLQLAERVVLSALSKWRVRGHTRRLTEWLEGISAIDAEHLALAALQAAGIAFSMPLDEAQSGSAAWAIRSAGLTE